MTDQQFAESTHQLAEALIEMVRRRAIPTDDAAQLLGAAYAEAMAAFIGAPSVVERLRDIADYLERQIMDDADIITIG